MKAVEKDDGWYVVNESGVFQDGPFGNEEEALEWIRKWKRKHAPR